jgi:hypothetical protein
MSKIRCQVSELTSPLHSVYYKRYLFDLGGGGGGA